MNSPPWLKIRFTDADVAGAHNVWLSLLLSAPRCVQICFAVGSSFFISSFLFCPHFLASVS